jgi:hypothetical protein
MREKEYPNDLHSSHKNMLIIPASLVLVSSLLLIIFKNTSEALLLSLFLVGWCGAIWITASSHIVFKNIISTSIIAVGTLLMLLVAYGVISPQEIVPFIEKLIEKTP